MGKRGKIRKGSKLVNRNAVRKTSGKILLGEGSGWEKNYHVSYEGVALIIAFLLFSAITLILNIGR